MFYMWIWVRRKGGKLVYKINLYHIQYYYIFHFQVKCHQYWPIGSKSGGEDVMELKDVNLKVELISETDGPYFATRGLR